MSTLNQVTSLRFFFVLCITIACSCEISVTPGYIEEDKEVLESEIEKIHSLFNEGKYNEIIKNAIPTFTEAAGKEKLILSMKQTKKDFGSFESTYEKWINIIVRAPVEGRAVYNCKFSKSDVTEIFIFIKNNKSYKLASYQIYPGITKPKLISE